MSTPDVDAALRRYPRRGASPPPPHRTRCLTMWSWRRRDVRRTCLRCGTVWIVSHALAKAPRASKWQRGVSAPDRLGFRGMDTNAGTAMQLDMAKVRSAHLDHTLSVVSAMDECPSCGALGVFTEERVPRRPRGRADRP
jgi:ribosomal protein S27AE